MSGPTSQLTCLHCWEHTTTSDKRVYAMMHRLKLLKQSLETPNIRRTQRLRYTHVFAQCVLFQLGLMKQREARHSHMCCSLSYAKVFACGLCLFMVRYQVSVLVLWSRKHLQRQSRFEWRTVSVRFHNRIGLTPLLKTFFLDAVPRGVVRSLSVVIRHQAQFPCGSPGLCDSCFLRSPHLSLAFAHSFGEQSRT